MVVRLVVACRLLCKYVIVAAAVFVAFFLFLSICFVYSLPVLTLFIATIDSPLVSLYYRILFFSLFFPCLGYVFVFSRSTT